MKSMEKERWAWLAGCLLYTGRVDKAVFAEKFDIGVAQVSRDVAHLNGIMRENGLDTRIGRHGTIEGDVPVEPVKQDVPSPSAVLSDLMGKSGRFVEVRVQDRPFPDVLTLRTILQAIETGMVVSCRYISPTSAATYRTLTPHAVVHADGRLHVRAWEAQKGYRDFVVSRMSGVYIAGRASDAVASGDVEWQTWVDIVLHVRHADPEVASALARDIGADPYTLERRIPTRKALVPYTLPLYKGGRYALESYIEVFTESSTS